MFIQVLFFLILLYSVVKVGVKEITGDSTRHTKRKSQENLIQRVNKLLSLSEGEGWAEPIPNPQFKPD